MVKIQVKRQSQTKKNLFDADFSQNLSGVRTGKSEPEDADTGVVLGKTLADARK